jgi:transposase InsO family protein
VKDIRMQMPRVGTRKLYHLLQDDLKELGVGRDKLFSILKANQMHIIAKRSYHITTDSHHRFRKHKNIVAQLPIVRPEQVWVSDITYIGNRKNPMYLALVTDAYSKKIIGYDVSNSLCTVGSIRALSMATKSRSYKKEELIHHSDRGLQYCSDDYQKLLGKKNIKCSMTESYDPYANAVAERVNGILKQEFLGYDRKLPLRIMKRLVKDSVRVYNDIRPHYSSHMLTPKQMHRQRKVQMRTYKNKNSVENVLNTV